MFFLFYNQQKIMFRLTRQCIHGIPSNRILHLDLLSYKQKLGDGEIIIQHIIARLSVFLSKVFHQLLDLKEPLLRKSYLHKWLAQNIKLLSLIFRLDHLFKKLLLINGNVQNHFQWHLNELKAYEFKLELWSIKYHQISPTLLFLQVI